jgi:hypothetical protein
MTDDTPANNTNLRREKDVLTGFVSWSIQFNCSFLRAFLSFDSACPFTHTHIAFEDGRRRKAGANRIHERQEPQPEPAHSVTASIVAVGALDRRKF